MKFILLFGIMTVSLFSQDKVKKSTTKNLEFLRYVFDDDAAFKNFSSKCIEKDSEKTLRDLFSNVNKSPKSRMSYDELELTFSGILAVHKSVQSRRAQQDMTSNLLEFKNTKECYDSFDAKFTLKSKKLLFEKLTKKSSCDCGDRSSGSTGEFERKDQKSLPENWADMYKVDGASQK